MRRNCPPRRGATAVEFSLVGSLTFLLLMGIGVTAIGVFSMQQVARLARDASRWASVHGTSYASATGKTAATSTDVYNNAIVPGASGLDLTKLTYSVTWNASNSPYHVSGGTANVANTVSVVVNYNWIPAAYLGSMTLSSTSVTVMSY